MVIKNGLVLTWEEGFVSKDLYIEDGRFQETASGDQVIDANGDYVIPGLIDIHFHGCAGYDFCDATQESLSHIAEYELKNGITSICPASMTLAEETLTDVCKNADEFAKNWKTGDGSRLCGINLEGPFIAENKKGAQNPRYIKEPDREMFLRLKEASGDRVKLITIAPEVVGALEFIKEFSDTVGISIGHTECDYQTAKTALRLGARHLTHLYNAMPGLTHRAPGPIGAAFGESHAMAEIICDGIHIAPAAVRAAFQLFSSDRMILISDSMMATGMEDGMYSLGGLAVKVKGNLATLEDGTIAGSATNLMGCLRTAVSMGIPLETAVKCASYNPAKAIRITDQYGSIENGKVADCLLLKKDTLELTKVIQNGECVVQ